MIGTVYRIDFPTGEFYIGATIKPLKVRFHSHIECPYSTSNPAKTTIRKRELIKGYTKSKLIDITTVVYVGENYRDYEGYLIHVNEGDQILNGLQPKYNKRKAIKINTMINRYSIKYKKEYKGMYK